MSAFNEVVTGALRDLRLSWRSLALTDLAYKALAFAILTPAVTGLLYWMRSGTSGRVLADADIARFFVTTRVGLVTLLLGSSLLVAITALEVSCLMAIGLAASNGRLLRPRAALRFAAANAWNVLRLAVHMVVRMLVGLVPFLLAGGAAYLLLLREHDINFYLARRPPAFWVAAAVVALLGSALAALVARTAARWALALPLVLFERVQPRRALGESARRSAGKRSLVLAILAAWAAAGLALVSAAGSLPELLGRAAAPWLGDSVAGLVAFLTVLALLWGALVLAAGIANVSLFSLLCGRLHLHLAGSAEAPSALASEASSFRSLSPRSRAVVAAVAVLAALGVALLVFVVTRSNRPTVVIAHRGSSAAAPENTLAAFRLAVEQGADYVELDVQESSDGEVLVAHDTDLMKLAGFPGKIWETDAATLRSIDIGSGKDPKFSAERVPTLAEALAVCKGRSRVIVELKSYGHDQKLEERVAAIVEAAGMQDACAFMSLDHGMVRNMKRLRPSWRSGILVATARGDLTTLGADFLAVEARMATPRFVRRAHRAGQDVYVWTVNDPAWMLTAMSRGVDGLITDRPDLAREVVARREAMSDGQRFLVALLVRLGARTEALESVDALRP
ncbi:MAG TPA: glycerophosphodiester phosphodiesterase [Candidatus Polarisedimenticolaceae bacterium]